jgi:glutamine amidotransferase
VALENTHPFVRELWGRYWVFAHNGDLGGLPPRLHGAFRPVGDTDSERAFCWLMQELAKAHAAVPSVAELTLTLRELLPQPAAHGNFNLLLSNGRRCGPTAAAGCTGSSAPTRSAAPRWPTTTSRWTSAP